MVDDADRSESGEQGAAGRPEGSSWPPTSGTPDPDGPAGADQPTPEQPSGLWGESAGPWEESPAPWRGGDSSGSAGDVFGGEAQDPWLGEDETQIHPAAAEETSALPPLDPNATSILPPSGGDNDPTRRWAARAGVPPPGARPAQQPEWVEVEEARGGAWWMPILVSIIVLILLALLGLGLWLGFRGDRGGPAPVNSPTGSPSAFSPSPVPSPSPSLRPSVSPSPSLVSLPSLRGVAVDEAQQLLTGLGLVVQVQQRPDNTLPPGTVLETQPDAGTQVPVGSTVTLVVASAPSLSPPPPSSSPSLPAPSPSVS